MTSAKRLVPLLLLVGMVVSCGRLTNSHQDLAVVVGKQAPNIQGHDADGTALQLNDYRGKVVLLDFWKTG
jgi:hypothetical protein